MNKKRTDRLVPFEMYADPGSFSPEEIQIIKKIADQYYYGRPVKAQNQILELNTQETKENAKWYLELDSILAEAESKKMLQDRYGSSL
jgi:hypothetical protein